MKPSLARLFGYAAPALPLAMGGLPLYVHAPKFYADTTGMSLALMGLILLLARLFDAFTDPLIGLLSDRGTAHLRRLMIVLGAPLFGLGMLLLFHPDWRGEVSLALWLGLSLFITYLAFSLMSVNHTALGAEISRDYMGRSRVAAVREGLGLVGVLLGAALPSVLMATRGETAGLALFSWLFFPAVLLSAALLWRYSPDVVPVAAATQPISWRSRLASLAANRPMRWLLAVFILQGIAFGITSTLVLFFVADVLSAAHLAGLFLVIYFITGAAALPLWLRLAARIGKRHAWLISMGGSVAIFLWTYFLGAGDTVQFALVCAGAGVFLGATLALAPSLLADVMDHDRAAAAGEREGLYSGIWGLAAKLNLALAAGLVLPLLQWLGYQPGTATFQGGALSFMYTLLPCLFTLAAAAVLWRSPLDSKGARPCSNPYSPVLQ
jgi:Na+/melibiose symporter-like transporter